MSDYTADVPGIDGERILREIYGDNQDEKIELSKKIRYYLYDKELQKLASVFCQKGIQIVFMKGIVLARKLYTMPWNRNFCDIDILVSPEKLFDAVRVLETMKYATEADTDKNSIEIYLKEIDREHHLLPFVKQEAGSFPFVIELHVDIVPAWMFQIDNNLTAGILSRRKIRQRIPEMEKYDELIFQILHLLKHYVFDMTMGFINGNIHAYINIRDLHEIALLLEKWEGEFDHVEFMERVRKYTVENEVLLVVKWLQEIYPFTKRKFKEMSLEEREKGCFVSRFCRVGRGMSTRRILFGESRKIAGEAIRILQRDSVTIRCGNCGDEVKWPDGKAEWIQFDNQKRVTDNRYGTYLAAGRYREGILYSVRFCFLWNREHLYFFISIDNPSANYYRHLNESEILGITGYDFVRLHFDTGKRGEKEPYVRAFKLKPYYTYKGDMDIYIEEEFYCTGGGIHLMEKGTCRTAAVKKGNRCYMMAGIPWEHLQYRPEADAEVYFDVWMRTEDFLMECQNAYHAWYDVSGYGRFRLCR